MGRALWYLGLGGFLLLSPRLNSGGSGVLLRWLLFILRTLVAWTLVWLFTLWAAPGWLTSSRAGMQTALQVLPATAVALLVLVLGSLYAVVQVALSNWGSRAPVMLMFDEYVGAAVIRPLLLVAATLL